MPPSAPAPLLLPAVSLVVGVSSAPWLAGSVGPPLALGAAALATALLVRGAPGRVLTAVGWFALGLARAGGPETLPPTRDDDQLWEIVVVERPGEELVDVRLLRAADGPEDPGRALPAIDARLAGLSAPARRELRPGQRLLVRARLRPARRGGPPWLLARRGAGLPVVIGGESERGGLGARAVDAGRRRVRRALRRGAPPDVRALFEALVLGDRSGLDPQLREAFSRTGTAHLLAISGLHVGTAAVAARALLLRPARRLGARLSRGWAQAGGPDRPAAVAALGVAAAYVALAGAPVSARRALVMVAAGVLAFALRRRPSGWNALATAALVVVWWDPDAARSLGFQLSFSAVAGLLWAAPVLAARSEGRSRAFRVLLGATAASVVSTVATAPLCALTWDRVPVAGAWVNLPAVPLLGAATLPPLLLGACLALIGPEPAEPWFRLAALPARAGLWLVRRAAAPEICPVLPWSPGPVEVGLIYGACAVLAVRRAEA